MPPFLVPGPPRRILHFPRPHLRALASGGPSPIAYLGRPTHAFCLGRDALFRAFRLLSPHPGAPAWLPPFHCGLEVQAALDAGCSPRFYPVNADLTVDLHALKAGLRREPGPVLVVHYFGMPQPNMDELTDLCRERGAALIEDCCHALFSLVRSRPLGSYGVAAAFSLSKVLGTPDGGILALDLALPEATRGPVLRARRPPLWPLRTLLGRKTPWLGPPEVSSSPSGPDRPALPIAASGDDHHPRDYSRSASLLSRRMAAGVDGDGIRACRRRNYHHLADGLEDWLAPMAPVRLPDGVSPLSLPLLVADRDRLRSALSKRGVETFVFGHWPHPAMDPGLPGTARLRRHLLNIPVHQQLAGDDLARIREALHHVLPAHAGATIQ